MPSPQYNVRASFVATPGNLAQVGQIISEMMTQFSLTGVKMTLSFYTDQDHVHIHTPSELLGWLGEQVGNDQDVDIAIS